MFQETFKQCMTKQNLCTYEHKTDNKNNNITEQTSPKCVHARMRTCTRTHTHTLKDRSGKKLFFCLPKDSVTWIAEIFSFSSYGQNWELMKKIWKLSFVI